MGLPDIVRVRAAIAERQAGDDEVFQYIAIDRVKVGDPSGRLGRLAKDAIIIPLRLPEERQVDTGPLHRFGVFLEREFGATVVITRAENE